MAATPSGQRPTIAAEAFLRALADHGIDYFFANPGTDFPPIVEAFSRAKQTNAKVPTPILVPHENLAVAMAHGAYLMNGRPQAVMLHVNVGTANAINNIINLIRDRMPLILAAGRTPITEKGKFGGRNRSIHWAQEMFDQAGMLREPVKWDYELRVPEPDRRRGVARLSRSRWRSPRGPVYLVLPREPLAAPMPEPIGPVKPRRSAAPAACRSAHDRDAGRMDRGGGEAADHHRGLAGRGDGAARPHRRKLRASRSLTQRRAWCACRPAIRCIWATSPGRCCRRPTSSSSSMPTCRGSRNSSIRRPAAASRISARTRSSCAIRCAASRAILRSG